MAQLHLRTFGGLTLQQDGENITGVATQRRQLALLALLAVAGDEGLSREKILAYLWPERETERARHTLNQLLYMQRRLTDDPELFQGRKTLRIYPELIETDVRRFREALARADAEAAVKIYRGPFLDGFFLDKAPAFEDWVTEWRQRFQRQYLDVLDVLADRAAAASGLDAALEWRRLAAAADPLNPRLAHAHAEAFLACGNRAGALRVLATHRERLKDELGIEPEPELRQLEDRIRNGSARPT